MGASRLRVKKNEMGSDFRNVEVLLINMIGNGHFDYYIYMKS